MSEEQLLELYNEFYQYFSYEDFEKLISGNEKFRTKFKETNKGLNKVLKSRKIWKNRYYLEKEKRKQEKENLIKYIEDKIKECKNTLEMLEGTGSFRNSILQVQIKNYENLSERIKSESYD